jgi:hypothetical protein
MQHRPLLGKLERQRLAGTPDPTSLCDTPSCRMRSRAALPMYSAACGSTSRSRPMTSNGLFRIVMSEP